MLLLKYLLLNGTYSYFYYSRKSIYVITVAYIFQFFLNNKIVGL